MLLLTSPYTAPTQSLLSPSSAAAQPLLGPWSNPTQLLLSHCSDFAQPLPCPVHSCLVLHAVLHACASRTLHAFEYCTNTFGNLSLMWTFKPVMVKILHEMLLAQMHVFFMGCAPCASKVHPCGHSGSY